MKVTLAVGLVAGCSFSGGGQQAIDGQPAIDDAPVGVVDGPPLIDDAPSDGPPGTVDAAVDAAVACWNFTPTNFDPCMLTAAAPVFSVLVNTTINTDILPGNGIRVAQGNNAAGLLVLHVATFSIAAGATLTVEGTRGLVLAVDGNATISGDIITTAAQGVDCTTANGGTGTDAIAPTGGGGGGGGAGGGTDGEIGGDGAGVGMGTKGTAGIVVTDASTVSPLRGGCRGGNGSGVFVPGGPGGGAFQITSRQTIAFQSNSFVSAAGTGGFGGPAQRGGGGGGAGGSLLFEGGNVEVNTGAVVCADGGSGGQGGGGGPGRLGVVSPCTGTSGASPMTAGNAGGAGGTGGYKLAGPSVGGPGAVSTAGGGGGGAAGSIRMRGYPTLTIIGVVTPQPTLN